MSFGQDGGIGRNTSLPCTTKRKITTNLETIKNQKWQNIKLHWTPTTKELNIHPDQCAKTKKYVQRKEQIKTPEKGLSDEEIDDLSDAEFKTLVIRMLTEMIELGHKINEEVKAIQSEIKQNIQGTNSDGKETGIQIHDLQQKQEINIPLEQNEETRIQKNEERLRNIWDNFKHSNIWIIGMPEGEEQEQEV